MLVVTWLLLQPRPRIGQVQIEEILEPGLERHAIRVIMVKLMTIQLVDERDV